MYTTSFDPWQFAANFQKPVSARYVANDWETPGLSYDDFSRMGIGTMGLNLRGKNKARPAWARNDKQTREVIVRFMEKRAFMGRNRYKQGPGTQAERMARAEKLITKNRAPLIAIVDRLCSEYVALKQSGGDIKRLRELEILIQNVDTQLCMQTRTAAIVAGVIFYYLRLGLDCVDVSQRIHIQPPHVRMIAYRLCKIGAALESEISSSQATAICKEIHSDGLLVNAPA